MNITVAQLKAVLDAAEAYDLKGESTVDLTEIDLRNHVHPGMEKYGSHTPTQHRRASFYVQTTASTHERPGGEMGLVERWIEPDGVLFLVVDHEAVPWGSGLPKAEAKP